MSGPWFTRHPRVAVGIAFVVAAVGAVGLVLNLLGPAHFDSRAGEVLLLLGVPVDALVGAYLISRRPENALGYLMVLIAIGLGLDSPAKAVLNLELGGRHGAAMSWALLVDNTTWSLTYLGVALLVLLYPDGRPAGPRWVRVQQLVVTAWAALFVLCLLVPTSADDSYPDVRTPMPVHITTAVATKIYVVPFLTIVGCIVAGIVGLFLRARRSRRTGDVVTAAQIRWLAWAGVVAIAMVASQDWIDGLVGDRVSWLGNVVSELGPYALLVALVVAVTRHGLFEIDRVVSRTVSYVVISGLLLGVYACLIAGLSALLPSHIGSVAVVAATLAVSALFIPVRRTVQRRIDRRFNRQRYDRAQLVERFADQLRRDPTHGSGSDLLSVVHDALQPAHAGLWLASR